MVQVDSHTQAIPKPHPSNAEAKNAALAVYFSLFHSISMSISLLSKVKYMHAWSHTQTHHANLETMLHHCFIRWETGKTSPSDRTKTPQSLAQARIGKWSFQASPEGEKAVCMCIYIYVVPLIFLSRHVRIAATCLGSWRVQIQRSSQASLDSSC